MGLAASQTRLLTLTSRLTDVETQMQLISSQKMYLAAQTDQIALRYSEYIKNSTDNTDDNRQQAIYDSAMRPIQNEENLLDVKLTQLNTEHAAAQKELESAQALVNDNAKSTFAYFS